MSLALGGLYPSSYAEAIRRRLEHQDGKKVYIADLGSGSGHWYAIRLSPVFGYSPGLTQQDN